MKQVTWIKIFNMLFTIKIDETEYYATTKNYGNKKYITSGKRFWYKVILLWNKVKKKIFCGNYNYSYVQEHVKIL